MSSFKKINRLLSQQRSGVKSASISKAMAYANAIASLENAIVVVSDLLAGSSRIVAGRFASVLGLELLQNESSIWERQILSLMSEQEQDRKFISELRFFNFIMRLPPSKRSNYHLETKLRISNPSGKEVDVLHKMYYLFSEDYSKVECAVCVYLPLSVTVDFHAAAIDTVGGRIEVINSQSDGNVLSARELQVLSCVDAGLTSAEIATRLNISANTVSRHRQQIIAKLQVKNSIEACRIAKSMKLI